MNARILLNRGGGSAGGRPAVERALRDAGIAGELQWLDGNEIAQAAESTVAEGADLVVAGGGDGTVGAVAGALAGTNAKLGILPLGTQNHFARDLGISRGAWRGGKASSGGHLPQRRCRRGKWPSLHQQQRHRI